MKDLAPGYQKYAPGTFPGATTTARNYLKADLAGQNINGRNVDWEPTGPNSTLATDKHGNQLFPGPGGNGFITRQRRQVQLCPWCEEHRGELGVLAGVNPQSLRHRRQLDGPS